MSEQTGTKKIAYVTGGMGGIGTSICQHLAKAGYQVVASHSLKRDAQTWLNEQKALGFNFIASALDVASLESCQAAVADIKTRYGSIDVLVNNAGITRDGLLRRMSADDWLSVMGTNLNGAFYMIKQVLDDMIDKKWGRIINIASINAQKGQFGQGNYAASKAGLHGLTMSLAQEVANRGITVNTVSPGYIATEMVMAVRPEILDKIVASIPVKRLGQTHEIASMVAWLSGEDAAFTTGADFSINGGMYTH